MTPDESAPVIVHFIDVVPRLSREVDIVHGKRVVSFHCADVLDVNVRLGQCLFVVEPEPPHITVLSPGVAKPKFLSNV